MSFTDALAGFIGRTIEVFQMSQFLQGTLLSVGNGFFSIEVTGSGYYPPTGEVTVFVQNVEFVRILAP
ncbi:hypothetical protein ACFQZT_07660 [Paenibacillus sp. GCM10027628]|uniref:hypothetical protein n=1 Tax=Paenibacillus sp. GCM10027628 TaxID=3273413 RepID=UPI0036326548